MVETESILIVDDNEIIIAVLKEILQPESYTVQTAGTGKRRFTYILDP